MKIACSKYSDLDDKVISKATEFGLPIIGGTALEIWSNHLKHPGVRKRSDNDLDFQTNSRVDFVTFQRWVQNNINSDKVQVDVYFVKSHNFDKYLTKVDGVLTLSLPYLLWSKLVRHSEKDIKDIKWILSVPSLTDEEIESALEDLGVTNDEIKLLESLC